MKQIWQYRIAIILIFASVNISAQVDSTWQKKPELRILGFADVFYVYDFNEPQGQSRQLFLFNHNRHNEFNLNLGLIKFAVEQQKYRANFALQTGTYANDNYSAEQGVIKNILEANIGISLNKTNNLWIDAGVLPSHIGFESAISMDNPTFTRSLLAENSPYFLAGAKLTYNINRKWEVAGLIVNGWQRIQRLEGNSLPSIGTQVNFSPNEKMIFNWSSLVGTDDPDETRRMRYFNNFFGQFQITENFDLTAGFDIGSQQTIKGSSNYDIWFSPILIGQFKINENWRSAIRMEYYQDETGIIIPTETVNGFQTSGFSLNLDYTPEKNIACRLEGRFLHSKDDIFVSGTGSSNNNFIIGTSIAIKFAEKLSK